MTPRIASLLYRLAAPLLLTLFCAALAPAAEAAPPRPPRPTPAVAPVSDPTTALSACASDIFGLKLSYTRTSGLTAAVAQAAEIPSPSKGVISAAINANVTALYGTTSNGAEALVYGSGSGSAGDASVAVSSASLCALAFSSTKSMPSSADAALSLLKSTFPGVPQRAPYATIKVASGYGFYIATTHPVASTGEQTAQGLLLTATKDGKGRLVLGGLSGTGTYAASIPAR